MDHNNMHAYYDSDPVNRHVSAHATLGSSPMTAAGANAAQSHDLSFMQTPSHSFQQPFPHLVSPSFNNNYQYTHPTPSQPTYHLPAPVYTGVDSYPTLHHQSPQYTNTYNAVPTQAVQQNRFSLPANFFQPQPQSHPDFATTAAQPFAPSEHAPNLALVDPRTVQAGSQSMQSSSSHGSPNNEPADKTSHGFPWMDTQDFTDGALQNAHGETVVPSVHPRVEKGIDWRDGVWVGYRRNYVEISAAHTLSPISHGLPLYLNERPVWAMGLQVAAVTLDSSQPGRLGKSVGMFQFTAKRLNFEKRPAPLLKVAPGLPLDDHTNVASWNYMPVLPLQKPDEEDPKFKTPRDTRRGCSADLSPLVMYDQNDEFPRQQIFERLQFKHATGNNGRRRAAQQYFHVVMQLYADVRDEGAAEPKWELIAHRSSHQVVVRGRSPNHYDLTVGNRGPKPKPPRKDDRRNRTPKPRASRSTQQQKRQSGTAAASSSGIYPNSSTGYGQFCQLGSNTASITPEMMDSPSTDRSTEQHNLGIYHVGLGDDLSSEIHQGMASDSFHHTNYTFGPRTMLPPMETTTKHDNDFDSLLRFPRSFDTGETSDITEPNLSYEASVGFYPIDSLLVDSP